LAEKVAASLAQGEIVAWFQGRAEVGPRALGARSLLGDPRSRATLVRLNKMKSREMWRPLAPSVLAESYSTYFEDGRPSRYMIIASMVKPEQRYRIPAVTHVDGTVRPQVVEHEANPRFWKLLKAFERKTGIPMVVNTSFNIEAEPIVNSPQDAVRSFLASSADCLAIGDALVFAKPRK
jgi:carbamoyltransferase